MLQKSSYHLNLKSVAYFAIDCGPKTLGLQFVSGQEPFTLNKAAAHLTRLANRSVERTDLLPVSRCLDREIQNVISVSFLSVSDETWDRLREATQVDATWFPFRCLPCPGPVVGLGVAGQGIPRAIQYDPDTWTFKITLASQVGRVVRAWLKASKLVQFSNSLPFSVL